MVELVNEVGVSLIDAAASDDMVAMAAWVSFDMDSEGRLADRVRVEKLINFLYRARHMSPFEHGHFTFKVDVPLFVAREFMRHRTASYNEVSGRYTEMTPRFYVGDVARIQKGKPGDYYFESGTDEQTAKYLRSKQRSAEFAWEEYQLRLEEGIAKEQAREDLPLSLMTQFYVTMNPRNLMQFLTLRNDSHALKEIRDVAVKMEEIFAQHMPITYNAYRTVRDEQQVDVEALQLELKNALSNNASLRESLEISYKTIATAENRAKEAQALRDEAVTKYNGLYSTQHAASEKSFKYNDVADKPKDVNINIVAEALKNPEELARLVLQALRENNHRRR